MAVGVPFKKGNPGKKKGTISTKTKVLKSLAQSVIEENEEKFKQELQGLRGKPFLDAYLTLFEYVYPKLQRTTHVGDADSPITFRVTTPEK